MKYRNRRYVKRVVNRGMIKWLVIGVAILVIAGLLVERFVHKGTLLGYQVRKVDSDSKQKQLSNDENQKSQACESASAEAVGEVLGAEVLRIGGSFADRTKPTFISSCSYKSVQKPSRSVTIVLRDAVSNDAAKSALDAVAKNNQVDKIDNLGDNAYFSHVSQQLTVVSQRRITTVTINKPHEVSQIESKDAAVQIAKLILTSR